MNKTNKYDAIGVVNRMLSLLGGRDQSELTDYLGLKKYALTEWKNGKSKSFEKYFVKIAEFFNVSLDFLVFGKQTFSLSEEEETFLKMYRYIDDKEKPSALEYIRSMAENRVSSARMNIKPDMPESETEEDYQEVAKIARMYDWLYPEEKPIIRNMIEERLRIKTENEYLKYKNMGKEFSREAVGIVEMYFRLGNSERAVVEEQMTDMLEKQLDDALHNGRNTDIIFAVARSDNEDAPRIITNDLDDIISAPDFTDEY